MKIGEIINDPTFKNLPQDEQRRALSEMMPGFGDLPISEQDKGMTEMGLMPSQVSTLPAPIPTAQGQLVALAGKLPAVGQGIVEQLPTAGMLFGGGLGTLTGGPVGGVAGAGLGAGIGQAGKGLWERFQGKPITAGENIANIAQAVPAGAMSQMGGEVAGKILEKAVLAPGAKYLTGKLKEGATYEAAKALADQGVPVSPELIAPSRTAKAVQWLAERFQPGKSIVDSYRKQSMDMIMQMRRDLVEDLGLPAVGSMPLGQAKERISQVFQTFREAAGPEAVVPLANTKTFLEGLNADAMGTASAEFVNNTKAALKNGTATVADIERINASLWPKAKAYGRMSATDKAWREEFLQNLYKDLGAHEEAIGVNLAQLLQGAKATTREIYQAQFVEKLLDRATDNERMIFNPMRFYDLVRNNQNAIQRTLDKDVAANLFNFAEKMKAVAPERQKFLASQMPQSWWEQAISTGPAAGALAGTMAQPAMAIPLGFQAIVARSMMNPSGVVRKWLTTGLKPPELGKAALKAGLLEEMNK